MIPELDKKYDWDVLKEIVKRTLSKDISGHDYAHTMRVLNNSYIVARSFKAVDYNVLTAACMLHDIHFDEKSPKTHHITSAEKAVSILKKISFEDSKIRAIRHAILNHNRNFSSTSIDPASKMSVEAKILYDGDTLDAFGSIGIIRMISFSLSQGIPYFKSTGDNADESVYGNFRFMSGLANTLLTAFGRKLARERAKIMQQFLKELSIEADV